MNFGYLGYDALSAADLSLPPDDPGNAALLQRCPRREGPMPLWVGCAEYRVKEWIERGFYPPGTKEADMLHLYSRQFPLLEMNATHYRIYEADQIRKWTSRVDRPEFRFLPKFPQAVSHSRPDSGLSVAEATAQFTESVQAFLPYLGPVFLQMSEHYAPARRAHLFRYLASLPEIPGLHYFVELRHPDWFLDPMARQDLMDALRDLGIGLVLTDTPGHREVCHMALTVPRFFIRFVGKHSHPSTGQRLLAWADRLGQWAEQGTQEGFFVCHTGFSAPLTAAQARTTFSAQRGLLLC